MKLTFENSFWGVVKLAIVVGGLVSLVAILASAQFLVYLLGFLAISSTLLFMFDRRGFFRIYDQMPWRVTEPSARPITSQAPSSAPAGPQTAPLPERQ